MHICFLPRACMYPRVCQLACVHVELVVSNLSIPHNTAPVLHLSLKHYEGGLERACLRSGLACDKRSPFCIIWVEGLIITPFFSLVSLYNRVIDFFLFFLYIYLLFFIIFVIIRFSRFCFPLVVFAIVVTYIIIFR